MAVDQSSERWLNTFLNDDVQHKDPPCILLSRPWESIPSESGPSRIHSSIPHSSSLYDTSSLSEASLVRLTINALQGVESALKSINKICTVFFSDPADRTYHRIPSLWNRSLSTVALGRILETICRSGYIVYQLLQFVDYFRTIEFDRYLKEQMGSKFEEYNLRESGECPPYSLVNQAFAVSVGKILEGYTSALDTLHASAVMRRLSKTFDLSSCASSRAGLLTSVAHSEVTLLEVYLHTEGLRTQIDVLGNICNLHDIDLSLSASFIETKFSEFPIGGNLLTYLYSQLKVSDPAHSGVLKFLFVRSFEPYSEFIRSWIYKAKFSDPYNEFIVEYPDSLLHYKVGSIGVSADFALATIREEDKVAVPCFLKEILVPLYRAGQQLQVLIKVLELSNTVGAGDNMYEEFLPFLRGSSSDFLSHSSPLTFNKGDLESMVILRNNCYNQMMEKLQRLSVKLDLRYQQVVHCGMAPISVSIGGRNQDTPVLSVWNEDSMTSSNTVNKQNLEDGALDSEASSTADENSYVQVPFNFSDCSSLASSEEQDQFDQLVETPDNFVNLEEQYLSALSFSSSIAGPTLSKDELSCSVETDQETYKLKDPNMYLLHRQYDKTNNDEYSLHLDLKASSSPWISETHDSRRQHDMSFPSGSPLNSCKHVTKENKAETMAHMPNSGLEVDYRNIQDTDEGALNCSATLSRYDSEENISKDQHLIGTYTLPDLSSSESWKVKYNSKFFCANPIVTKHYLNDRTCMPEEKGSREFDRDLSSFDFTSVQNPFSLPIAKSPGSPRHQIETKLSTLIDPVPSAACSTADVYEKEGHKGGPFLVKSSEMDRSPRWTEDARENVFQTTSSGGSGWQSLLSSSCNIDSNTGRDFETGLTGMLDIPLDFVIEKCLLEEILLQYRYVSKLTIKVLEEGFDLQGQLLALRRYHFMELADWADLFIMSLWHHKCYATGADKRISEIQGLLELSIQRSSCEGDSYRDRIYFYIKKEKKMSLSSSSAGIQSFNYLGLGYRVDWPVNIILTSGALEIYAEIFSFLIQVKLALSSLAEAWCSLKEHMHTINQSGSGSHKSEVLHFNIFMKLRQQVNHFVTTLQQYVQSQLSHVCWCKFLHSLKNQVKDMMDFESVHTSYLNDSLNICFLSDEKAGVASIIQNILQCALDFRSCLTGSTWQTGVENVDSSTKFSKTNISQVLNIKSVFYNNLKELYICYLKSPKHGEFSLSRFWDCLNYNDYYAEVIGKDVGHLALYI